jgi:hypothetical protein
MKKSGSSLPPLSLASIAATLALTAGGCSTVLGALPGRSAASGGPSVQQAGPSTSATPLPADQQGAFDAACPGDGARLMETLVASSHEVEAVADIDYHKLADVVGHIAGARRCAAACERQGWRGFDTDDSGRTVKDTCAAAAQADTLGLEFVGHISTKTLARDAELAKEFNDAFASEGAICPSDLALRSDASARFAHLMKDHLRMQTELGVSPVAAAVEGLRAEVDRFPALLLERAKAPALPRQARAKLPARMLEAARAMFADDGTVVAAGSAGSWSMSYGDAGAPSGRQDQGYVVIAPPDVSYCVRQGVAIKQQYAGGGTYGDSYLVSDDQPPTIVGCK